MYISAVSFTGNKYNGAIQQKSKSKPINNNSGKKIGYTTAIAAAFAAAIIAGKAASTPKLEEASVLIPYNSSQTSLEDIANTYDISEEAIKFYNNISDKNPASELKEIKIPVRIDYINDEIKRLQKHLYSPKLNDEERTNTELAISALSKKHEEQESVAVTYSDGKFLYININISEAAADDIKEKYEFGINIESLKKLFDIKEGGIENNNDIDSRIEIYSDDETKSYEDFTRNWFHNGDIIKVPLESIQMNDIDLESY